MNRYVILALTSLVFLLTAQPAFANAGTPLMWAGMLHLVGGNFLIGIFEAFLLSRLFRQSMMPFALLMVAANYLSAWAGFLILNVQRPHSGLDIYNVDLAFWLAAVAFFLLTVLFEAPFVFWGLPRMERGFRKALRGSFLIHLVSYTLLFGWYWMAGGRPLGQSVKVVPAVSLPLPDAVTLYYIGAKDGDVYRLSANNAPVRVHPLRSVSKNDRLFARPPAPSQKQADLVSQLDAPRPEMRRVPTILPQFASPSSVWTEESPRDTWMNFSSRGIPSLVNNPQLVRQYRVGFWPSSGLSAYNPATYQVSTLVVCDTPLVGWTVRNAIQLPDGTILFQFGEDQICLYDPDRARLSLVVRGRGPVVVKTAHTPSTRANDAVTSSSR